MREARRLKRKRQRCIKALCVLAFFGLITFFSPSTVGSAEKRSPAAALSAARGLARSIEQTSTTFAAEPIQPVKDKKILLDQDFTKTALSSSVPVNSSSTAPASSASVSSAVSASAPINTTSVSSSAFVSSSQSQISKIQTPAPARASVPAKVSVPVKPSGPIQSSAASQSSTSAVSAITDINWLIQKESSGNPDAENGNYKGIGQLSEAAYQKYLNRTWAQVKGNYDLQLQAMQAYIQDRYGSVAQAIAFWQQNGWY